MPTINATMLRHQARYYELLAAQMEHHKGDPETIKEYRDLATFLDKEAAAEHGGA